MSIEKHYRPTALEYYKTHVNGPELEDRHHVVPQAVATIVALLGLAGLAHFFVDRLPTWQTVEMVCDSGHAIALDLPASAHRIVYREGSKSVASNLTKVVSSRLSEKANFRLDRRVDLLCKIDQHMTVRAVID